MKRSLSSDSVEPEPEDQAQPTPTQPVPALASLNVPVSPPQRRAALEKSTTEKNQTSTPGPEPKTTPSLAAIEAGEVEVTDHLGIFSTKLSEFVRPASDIPPTRRISIPDWVDLYNRNLYAEGRHFVVHQHDHPVSGVHYDLRLQFSDTSSVSWSIMYGLPGDPNSVKLNRNATETRVHCLWSNLIETASSKTGSFIIWDTGEYEVLPYHQEQSLSETDDSGTQVSDDGEPKEMTLNSAKLREAFQNGKIRLRLHGTRLPMGYTITLRMDKSTNFARPIRKGPKRRRRNLQPKRSPSVAPSPSDSDSDSKAPEGSRQQGHTASTLSSEQNGSSVPEMSEVDQADHSDDNVDLEIQRNNAYTGSYNTIGSIHQRRWWLSLDRESSGFEPKRGLDSFNPSKKTWVRKQSDNGLLGFDPFYVRGPDYERSVVTGRLGPDVLSDEDVQGFAPRKRWIPVLK